jgi:hypothetical protein
MNGVNCYILPQCSVLGVLFYGGNKGKGQGRKESRLARLKENGNKK